MTQTSKYITLPALGLLMLAGGALAGYSSLASAQTPTVDTSQSSGITSTSPSGKMLFRGKGVGHPGKMPGVMGTVSAVNGSTVTIAGKDGKTYTVNASGATVQKMVTGSLADVVVGDTIGVHGKVSDTTVTADMIMDDIKIPSLPTKI